MQQTITRTLTFPKDTYAKFKQVVPERMVSRILSEFMEDFIARQSLQKLAKLKKLSIKEAKYFEGVSKIANKEDVKAVHLIR